MNIIKSLKTNTKDNFVSNLDVCSDDRGHVKEFNEEPAGACGVPTEGKAFRNSPCKVGQAVQNGSILERLI